MDDDIRDFLGDLFGDPPPRDTVPPTSITLDDLQRMNDMVGKPVTVTIPGKVITDVDGVPIGVTESRTEPGGMFVAIVSRREIAALGLTPEDVQRDFPNLTVGRA